MTALAALSVQVIQRLMTDDEFDKRTDEITHLIQSDMRATDEVKELALGAALAAVHLDDIRAGRWPA